jgi:3'(2'), 5'-bisphosphate nucleotidase
MMTEQQMTDVMPQLLTLSRLAGERILEIYDTDFDVEQKSDNSPLTQADLASHHTILDGLAQLTPQVPVLSEESRDITHSERASWSEYWLVDPLDGTREFVKRNGEFTVNIALIQQQQVVLGVVYAPVSQDLFYASRGAGSFHANGSAAAQKIQSRSPGLELTIAGSRSHPGERLQGFLERLGEHQLISMGSSLKFCLVAQGRADLYARLGPTSEWDSAAAQCVVEEAGGQVTDTSMQALRYNTKESLLNPDFFVFGANSRDWSSYLDE